MQYECGNIIVIKNILIVMITIQLVKVLLLDTHTTVTNNEKYLAALPCIVGQQKLVTGTRHCRLFSLD